MIGNPIKMKIIILRIFWEKHRIMIQLKCEFYCGQLEGNQNKQNSKPNPTES